VLCGSALRIYILIILHLGIVCIGDRGSATSRAFFSTLDLSLRAACGFSPLPYPISSFLSGVFEMSSSFRISFKIRDTLPI